MTSREEKAARGPRGDEARHLPAADLERAFAALSPDRDRGRLERIVSRREGGRRESLDRAVLTREEGVPGDSWQHDAPEKVDAQITMMRADVARLFANGQDLGLFGDNLLVDLDLSRANLPTGTRLRLGECTLEVTPEPHNGCLKFKQRVGGDALRMTADPRYRDLRLRGIYVKVIEPGSVQVGDAIEVLSRGEASGS